MLGARVLAGRYQLEVPLGSGASGKVWRARDASLQRPVAVKVVELGEIVDALQLAETIARFRREAMTVGQLNHPNIVTAYDAGRVGNELFLAMELAEGASLARVTEQRVAAGIGLLPVASVLEIAEQVCAGLAAAHRAGVVHRDIKPSNLMVTPRLQLKIIDFGVARLLADRSPRLTLPSQQIGTLLYVSPEQAAHEDVDGRADLYSLGCVLYELLAGQPPFMAEVPGALLKMQLRDQPLALSTYRADLPAGLEQLVADLLAKDRRHRPADASVVADRIRLIRAAQHSIEPMHEADRGTVSAAEQAEPSASATVLAAPTVLSIDAVATQSGSAAPTGEAARATVLAPDAFAAPADRQQEAATADQVAGPVTRRPEPQWPARGRQAQRRRRRGAAASTLVTAAVISAVAVILWQRSHDQLKVTTVAVAPARPPGNRCNVTVDVVGTIATNGKGGPISYQWRRSGNLTSPVSTVSAATGHDLVQVHLYWTFDGRGTDSATAELRVLTPEPADATTAFTYSCGS